MTILLVSLSLSINYYMICVDRRHGKGKLTVMKGDLKSVYEGEFAENKKDGEGTETNPGGFTYTGHWKQGKYV